MPRQRLGAFGNPGPIEDDLEQGAIYDASADEIAANLTRVLDAFEEYQDARAELRLSDRNLMRAFFGHMVKSGYAPGTINGWRRLLDTHHVTPRNIAEVRARLDVSAFLKAVDTVSGRTPRDDRRTGVTLEHVARFCVGFDGDAPRDLEYRAFMFMLIVTGNRPRHVRELDYIKLQGTKRGHGAMVQTKDTGADAKYHDVPLLLEHQSSIGRGRISETMDMLDHQHTSGNSWRDECVAEAPGSEDGSCAGPTNAPPWDIVESTSRTSAKARDEGEGFLGYNGSHVRDVRTHVSTGTTIR
jgi:hypothetical protein